MTNDIPSYLSDENQINAHTKDWNLLNRHGNLELWEFHDEVQWNIERCIKLNGKVIISFHDCVPNQTAYIESTLAFRAISLALDALQ